MKHFSDYVVSYKDFPKPGVVYWDFTYLLKEPFVRSAAISAFVNHFQHKNVTKVAAVESKGFTIGALIAERLNLPLILIRKPSLIPGDTHTASFVKEYGIGTYEIKADACTAADSVLIIYDIMAGAGATQAATTLMRQTGATVAGCGFVVELEYLHGREQLEDVDIFSLVKVAKKPNL